MKWITQGDVLLSGHLSVTAGTSTKFLALEINEGHWFKYLVSAFS